MNYLPGGRGLDSSIFAPRSTVATVRTRVCVSPSVCGREFLCDVHVGMGFGGFRVSGLSIL